MAVQSAKPSEETPLLNPETANSSPESVEEAEQGVPKSDGPNQSVGTTRALLIIFSLWALVFLQASNMSGLTTTSSNIAADLDAYSRTSWFNTAYLIASSSVAPLAGKLSQIFPPRNIVLISSCVFGLGGFVTSQAQSFAGFLVGRAISGIGGAGIVTTAIILILELTSKNKRGLFIGLLNAGYTSGVALGAVIAGALVSVTGWRALFGYQAPLAIIAGTSIFLSIPSSFSSGQHGAKVQTTRERFASIDYFGALTLTSTIVLFLYGMSSSTTQWVPIILSLLLLPLFVIIEVRYARNPVIPVTVLSSHGALLTCLAQLLFMASRWTVLFYTPVFAIAVKGWSPASAGSILVPTNFGFGLGGLLAGWLHINRAGSFYIPTLIAFFLFTTTLLTISQISLATTAPTLYIVIVFINGFFTGASLNYTLAQIFHLSPPSTHFIVSSLLSTFRGFAGSFGSAIGGGIFNKILLAGLEKGFEEEGLFDKEELIRKLLGSPALVKELSGVERLVAVDGYEQALAGLFLFAAGTSALALLVQAAAGWKEGKEREVKNPEADNGESE